jgi:hypothetical protein
MYPLLTAEIDLYLPCWTLLVLMYLLSVVAFHLQMVCREKQVQVQMCVLLLCDVKLPAHCLFLSNSKALYIDTKWFPGS